MFLYSKISGEEYNLIARSQHYKDLINTSNRKLQASVKTIRGIAEGSWGLFPAKNGSILTYTDIAHKILGKNHPQAMDRKRVKPFVMGFYLEKGQVPSLRDLERLKRQIPDDLKRLFEEGVRNYKNHPFYEDNPSIARKVRIQGDFGSNAWDDALQPFRETGELDKAVRLRSDQPNRVETVWEIEQAPVRKKDAPTDKKKELKPALRNRNSRRWMTWGGITAAVALIGLSAKLVASYAKSRGKNENNRQDTNEALNPSDVTGNVEITRNNDNPTGMTADALDKSHVSRLSSRVPARVR